MVIFGRFETSNSRPRKENKLNGPLACRRKMAFFSSLCLFLSLFGDVQCEDCFDFCDHCLSAVWFFILMIGMIVTQLLGRRTERPADFSHRQKHLTIPLCYIRMGCVTRRTNPADFIAYEANAPMNVYDCIQRFTLLPSILSILHFAPFL